MGSFVFQYANYCARFFSYWKFSFRSLLLLVCSAIGCQPILAWPPALVSLKLLHTWAFSSIIITRTPSHPKGLIVKQRTFFPGSFTWIYLAASFKWHSRTLGDFDLRWTLAFRHGGKWVFAVHTWTFSTLPMLSHNTHSLCDEFLIIV